MVELRDDALVFSFPAVHEDAVLRIEFQRTLRIPDDGREYPLPPGLGRFPIRHVDDFAERVPGSWLRRGGTLLPMYQSEALWLCFEAPHGYPFAVKVAAGKINAVTGKPWSAALTRKPQDYLSIPEQPWLDGYCVERGVIRQFVAMPLGSGYSVEEQLTGSAEHGGIQLLVHPLRASAYVPRAQEYTRGLLCEPGVMSMARMDMGLGFGGRMRQRIYRDPHDFVDWDVKERARCFVHLANALVWREITGEHPPTTPPTSAEYTRAGLPWFEYYAADLKAIPGSSLFTKAKSVLELGKQKGDVPLPENQSVQPSNIVRLRAGLAPHEVRDGHF
jgi:hypothetical protein